MSDSPLTDAELEAIQQRCEKATPAPWVACGLSTDPETGEDGLYPIDPLPEDSDGPRPKGPLHGGEVIRYLVPRRTWAETMKDFEDAEPAPPGLAPAKSFYKAKWVDGTECYMSFDEDISGPEFAALPDDLHGPPTTEVIASLRNICASVSLVTGDPYGASDVPLRVADAAFIANARQDIPRLLAEVARLRAEVARLTQNKE